MSNGALNCPRCGASILKTDTQCMSCGAELYAGHLIDETTAPGAQAQAGAQSDKGAADDTAYRTMPAARPIDWTDISSGGGFFDALARSARFFAACMSMLAAFPALILPPLLGVFMGGGVLALGYLLLQATGLWETFLNSREEKMPLTVYAVLAPVILLGYMCMLSVMGMVAHMVEAYLKGRRATLGQALADVLRNFLALFYLALISATVSVLMSAARRKTSSRAADVAMATAERTQHAAASLLVPVIMLEDVSLKEATARAYTLFRRRLLDIIIAELGLLLLNRVLGFLVAIVAAGLLVSASVWARAMLPVALASTVCLIVVVSAFTSFVSTAYYTCLYLWARAMEEARAESVAPPEPLAKALAA